MRTYLSYTRGVLLLSVLLTASPVVAAQASDELLKGAMVFAPASELNVLAAGAVEDSLKSCLGRIPVDATAGQRLLAEQNCAGEQETRTLAPDTKQF
jgi:hypothetical protein